MNTVIPTINYKDHDDLLTRMRVSGYSKTEREAVVFLTMMAAIRRESEGSSTSGTSEAACASAAHAHCGPPAYAEATTPAVGQSQDAHCPGGVRAAPVAGKPRCDSASKDLGVLASKALGLVTSKYLGPVESKPLIDSASKMRCDSASKDLGVFVSKDLGVITSNDLSLGEIKPLFDSASKRRCDSASKELGVHASNDLGLVASKPQFVSASKPRSDSSSNDLSSAASGSSRPYDSDDSCDSYSSYQRPAKGLSTSLSGLRVFASLPRGAATASSGAAARAGGESPAATPAATRPARGPRAPRARRDPRAARAPPTSPELCHRKSSARKCIKESKDESYGRTTRDLLLRYFSRRTLATHSLSGKRSPAFRHKPPKPRLDPEIIDSIVREVCEKHNVLPSVVRMAITTKCADETKMLLMRQKLKNGRRGVTT